MTPESSRHHHRAVKTQLDYTVVGIELTLISIIRGLALGVLVASSRWNSATPPLLRRHVGRSRRAESGERSRALVRAQHDARLHRLGSLRLGSARGARACRRLTSPGERSLLDDIIRDQRVNILFMMPMAFAFQALSWWLVHAYPEWVLQQRWHLLPIGLTLLFSLNYLYGGVRLLRRRQDWIVERNAQERSEP